MWAIVNWQFLFDSNFASNLKLPVCHSTDVNQSLCALIFFLKFIRNCLWIPFWARETTNMAHCFADNVNAWSTCLFFMDTLLKRQHHVQKRREERKKGNFNQNRTQNDRMRCAVDLWHDMQVFLSFLSDSLDRPIPTIATTTKLLV